MGCSTSRPTIAPLEALLVSAVKTAKSRSGMRSGKMHTFNALLLHFGQMKQGFEKIRQLFIAISVSSSGRIPSLETKLDILKIEPTSPAIIQILGAINLEGKGGVDGDDFLVVWTILYLLEANLSVQYPEICQALEIVEKSFVYFDSSCDGNLERSEMIEALQTTSARKDHVKPLKGAKRHRWVAELLFDVLDLDNSGKISFKEFLLGMRKIVLDEELEEEELMENLRSGSSTSTSKSLEHKENAQAGGPAVTAALS
jgi:calcium-binding protein CML